MKALPAPGQLKAVGPQQIQFSDEELAQFDEKELWNTLVGEVTDDLLAYTITMDDRYDPSYFHKYLSRVLRLAELGLIPRRIIITTPPRHGKSRLVAEEFPAWYLSKHPEREVIVSSYAQDRSNKISVNVRERLESESNMALFPACRVHPEMRKMDDWSTTAGGSFLSAGVGGPITGRGADLFVIDDPIKNREEAESPGQREKVWDWFTSTAYTRLSPTGIMVIIMTRWHEDDLVGRLCDPERRREMKDLGLDDEEYRVFKFPSICEKECDELGRIKDEALWPERWPVKKLNSVKYAVGSYDWAALYQCSPRVKGGNLAQRSWFDSKVIERTKLPSKIRWVRYWDLAASQKTYSDFSASFKMGIDLSMPTKTANIYLDFAEHFKKAWPEAKRRIVARAKMERIIVGAESQGMQKVACVELRNALLGSCIVRECTNDKDKLTKLLPFLAACEAGRVFLVKGEWHWGFFDELEAFPNGKHDDRVDAAAGGFNLLTGRGSVVLV